MSVVVLLFEFVSFVELESFVDPELFVVVESVVEFVLELEDTFNEEIDDEDAEKLSTIGEVVDYIEQHTAA